MKTLKFPEKRAEQFKQLHHGSEILLLGNVWDAVSARLLQSLGFKALGTSSAAISSVLGYPDGECMSADENLAFIKMISRAVDIPVSADIESGYGSTTTEILGNIEKFVQSGAVGLNLEDTKDGMLLPVAVMSERITAVKQRCSELDCPVFLNMRTDALLMTGSHSENINEAIERANKYAEAGADGIFVPDLGDLDQPGITRLVENIPLPLNLIVGENSSSVQEMEDLGVARLSFGPRMMRIMLATLSQTCEEILGSGTFEELKRPSLSYGQVNSLLS